MNIEQFKNQVDGAINDFTDGVSNGKEFRDTIMDILIKVAYPGNAHYYRFKPTDLLLSYPDFKKLLEEKEKNLHPKDLAWLYAWQFHDLSVSPMDDQERSQIRYGHHIGWFDRNCILEENGKVK